MHAFSIDHTKDRPDPRVLLHRGYFAHGLPRLIPVCRLIGHKPVVDGTDSKYGPEDRRRTRWVCCDRCGVRPEPQGHLDPDQWQLGQPYTGPTSAAKHLSPTVAKQLARRSIGPVVSTEPGPWPAQPEGVLGAELVIGRSHSIGADFKVGNCASEQTIAAHVGLGPLGALYVHAENYGTWLQRRLNPTGYESKVTGIAMRGARLEWQIWSPRDHNTKQPVWRHGSLKLDPRDRLFGRRHYDYQNVGDKQDAIVRMPHGDDHTVRLQLQRCTYGRTKRAFHSWTVDWECSGGIPTKPGGSGVQGSAVEVSAQAVKAGSWSAEAVAAIALKLTGSRARYDYPVPKAG